MNQKQPRNTLISHPSASNNTLDLMSEAASLVVDDRISEARAKIIEADIRCLTEWFHFEAQATTKVLASYNIDRAKLHKPPPERKTKGSPKKRDKDIIFERDGWHCRFCGIRVIDPEARKQLSKLVPCESREWCPALQWGGGNLDKHACIAVMASPDHVLPKSWCGSNDPCNLVTACYPCQFSRMEYRIKDCGILDPRNRDPVNNGWDGLRRVL